MEIPREYIDNFTRVIKTLSDDAKKKLATALESVTADSLEELRLEIIAIMDLILTPYTENAAAIAATFYDGLRDIQGVPKDGFYAVSEVVRDSSLTAGAVYTYTEKHPQLDDVLKKQLSKQVGYEIKRTVNETIADNADRDPAKPKYARVPKPTPTTYAPWSNKPGVTHNKQLAAEGTCMMCIVLASRGFVYKSREVASHAHDDCDCEIIPVWKKNTVQGYDETKSQYKSMYDTAEKAYRDGKISDDLKLQIEEAKKRHDERYDAGDTKTKWSDLNAILIVMRNQQGA